MVVWRDAAHRITISEMQFSIFFFFSFLSMLNSPRQFIYCYYHLKRKMPVYLFHSMKHCARLWSLIRRQQQQQYNMYAKHVQLKWIRRDFFSRETFCVLCTRRHSKFPYTKKNESKSTKLSARMWVRCLHSTLYTIYSVCYYVGHTDINCTCEQMKKLEQWLTAQTNDLHTFCIKYADCDCIEWATKKNVFECLEYVRGLFLFEEIYDGGMQLVAWCNANINTNNDFACSRLVSSLFRVKAHFTANYSSCIRMVLRSFMRNSPESIKWFDTNSIEILHVQLWTVFATNKKRIINWK